MGVGDYPTPSRRGVEVQCYRRVEWTQGRGVDEAEGERATEVRTFEKSIHHQFRRRTSQSSCALVDIRQSPVPSHHQSTHSAYRCTGFFTAFLFLLHCAPPVSCTPPLPSSTSHLVAMSKSKKAMFLQEWKEQVGTNMEHFHEGTALMVRKHQSQLTHTHYPPPPPTILPSPHLPTLVPFSPLTHSPLPPLSESNIKTAAFAATLHDMSQHEFCPSIKVALETLSTELTSAETARTALLSQLQAHVVSEFTKYPHKLKVQEVNIRARNKAFEKFVKKQRTFVTLKGNAPPHKQAHAKEVFDHERQRLQGAETTLNTSLAAFETARVSEMQAMLKKLISSQVHFFAKSMEGLTAAYARVCEIDGEKEGERLVEEMKKLEALEQKDDHAAVTAQPAAVTIAATSPASAAAAADTAATQSSGGSGSSGTQPGSAVQKNNVEAKV